MAQICSTENQCVQKSNYMVWSLILILHIRWSWHCFWRLDWIILFWYFICCLMKSGFWLFRYFLCCLLKLGFCYHIHLILLLLSSCFWILICHCILWVNNWNFKFETLISEELCMYHDPLLLCVFYCKTNFNFLWHH